MDSEVTLLPVLWPFTTELEMFSHSSAAKTKHSGAKSSQPHKLWMA